MALCVTVPTAVALALDVPPLSGRVVDTAGILAPSDVTHLTNLLAAHEQTTTNQVAVLTIPSLEGEELTSFSHRVATTWHLGRKGTDNGALLLVVLKERKIRIEAGYGLEGTLTDVQSAHIVRNDIVPHFKRGDFAGGITAGVDAILKTIAGTYEAPTAAPRSVGSTPDQLGMLLGIFAGILVGLLIARVNRPIGSLLGGAIASAMSPWIWPALGAGAVSLAVVNVLSAAVQSGRRVSRRARDDSWWYSTHDSGWSGSGFGGSRGGDSGFSGGGGDFGGGGASGDW
ncbi:MAG: TPM domain-containing protein [Nitrospiraceae bacterium]